MVRGLTLLFLCQLVGEAIVRGFDITFPGPVLGMALLLAGMAAFGRTGPALDDAADGILRNLSLLFVPAAVGVMQQMGLIAANWLAIAVAVVVSTVVTLIVTVFTFRGVARMQARMQARRRS
ncbi:CidA/LrgA family protein [Amaricoccus sp.]|uniref:CidA/LrgA family protein n=1 Tax=Amaricoccus sp. TaxID=1872485 RepID=UPI001B557D54|nr:CidA/LrgA family protein [Amaricoccus sp.]MBP7243274.1 CidA/LrgA family protein [Amaricoccus sp.]